MCVLCLLNIFSSEHLRKQAMSRRRGYTSEKEMRLNTFCSRARRNHEGLKYRRGRCRRCCVRLSRWFSVAVKQHYTDEQDACAAEGKSRPLVRRNCHPADLSARWRLEPKWLSEWSVWRTFFSPDQNVRRLLVCCVQYQFSAGPASPHELK